MFSKRFADSFDLTELFDAGLHDFPQPAEVGEQAAPPLLPHATDFFQTGGGSRFAASGAMTGDGETVRLIAYLLDQMQSKIVAG